MEPCPEHSGLVKEIASIKETLMEFKKETSDTLKCLTEKILTYAARPGWTVTIVISALSAICGTMATFILYTHFGK